MDGCWPDLDVLVEPFLDDKIVGSCRVDDGHYPISTVVDVHGGDEETDGIGDSLRYCFEDGCGPDCGGSSRACVRLSSVFLLVPSAVTGWYSRDTNDTQDRTDILAGSGVVGGRRLACKGCLMGKIQCLGCGRIWWRRCLSRPLAGNRGSILSVALDLYR